MQEMSIKVLREGFQALNVIEGIRYPLFYLWTTTLAFIGILFVADLLASKITKVSLSGISEFKAALFAKKSLVIALSVWTFCISFMLYIFPAGALDNFFGDFLPATIGATAGVFLFVSAILPESKFGVFVEKFNSVLGFAVLVVVVLHLFMPTISLL